MTQKTKLRKLLHKSKTETPCIVCSENTPYKSKCQCKTTLCKTCLGTWLGRKRQCMICNDDLLEFPEWEEHWVNHDLRDDIDTDPVNEVITSLIEITVNVIDDYELTFNQVQFFYSLLILMKNRIALESA